MTIILYDLLCSKPGYSVSPMTWRIRYCLGIKQIPYQSEWVEYSDIQSLYRTLGVSPTAKRPDGTGPHCTLPLIYDPSTKKYIAESFDIAEYLESQYPDTPSIFPGNTKGLHLAFTDGLWANVAPARLFLVWTMFKTLNPAGVVAFRHVREPSLGKKLEELVPAGSENAELDKLKEVLKRFETYYARTSGRGPFLMDDNPTWFDVVFASFLASFRVAWGKDSQQWKDVMNYPDGRWAVFMESMSNYE